MTDIIAFFNATTNTTTLLNSGTSVSLLFQGREFDDALIASQICANYNWAFVILFSGVLLCLVLRALVRTIRRRQKTMKSTGVMSEEDEQRITRILEKTVDFLLFATVLYGLCIFLYGALYTWGI